jgi:elongation factor P hydroxylase
MGTHAIHRTSPKGPGQKFIGTCSNCGMTGLTLSDMAKDCENVRGTTQDEDLIEAIEGPPQSFTWEQIARALFDLLDDCDTADDAAKSDDAVFRALVREAHHKRFDYGVSDGYTVKFKVDI